MAASTTCTHTPEKASSRKETPHLYARLSGLEPPGDTAIDVTRSCPPDERVNQAGATAIDVRPSRRAILADDSSPLQAADDGGLDRGAEVAYPVHVLGLRQQVDTPSVK
jgi:hypothetical protein